MILMRLELIQYELKNYSATNANVGKYEGGVEVVAVVDPMNTMNTMNNTIIVASDDIARQSHCPCCTLM